MRNFMKRWKRTFAAGLVGALIGGGSIGLAVAQQPPSMGYVPGVGFIISFVTRLVGPQVFIGSAGTALTTGIQQFTPTLTPVATAAAIGTTEQTFTVTGVPAGANVNVDGPAQASLCPMVHARVTAANTVALAFSTLTAAACTPAAGVYNITVIH